ncbi:MAG TPA: transcriptional regulator [Sphingomicrobium sp.]
MNVERGMGRHRIGGWEFSPATGELRRRTDVRRLEPRAAKALELLCAANGEVVSQDQLIDRVWSGRTLSDNSVAVVIGQLRKALDDDAREPRLIETIPKRGYRLRVDPAAAKAAGHRGAILIAGTLLAVLLLAVALSKYGPGRTDRLTVAVSDVANETGNPAYAPLARATSELIVAELDSRGFAVRRDGQGDLAMASKLVMWDGKPFLGINATDRSGVVRWSLMANAMPGRVPPAVDIGLDELATKFPPREGAGRLAEPPSDR